MPDCMSKVYLARRCPFHVSRRGVFMLLPSRLAKSDKDITNKGHVERLCVIFLFRCCIASGSDPV